MALHNKTKERKKEKMKNNIKLAEFFDDMYEAFIETFSNEDCALNLVKYWHDVREYNNFKIYALSILVFEINRKTRFKLYDAITAKKLDASDANLRSLLNAVLCEKYPTLYNYVNHTV